MSSPAEHYQHLLAKHYVWMFGLSFEEKVAEQRKILEGILNGPDQRGLALDLGSGPGFQSIALAQLGYSPVIAIDTSAELLAELTAHSSSLPIETKTMDLASLGTAEFCEQASVAVCMGDTLTHLSSRDEVERFFFAVHGKLAQEGAFVLTYRDLTSELTGVDRFLPVRSDDEKILTCFLEYENEDSVVVNDLLHLKERDGWKLEKSSYRKLRLSGEWVANALQKAGFRIERQEPAGRLSLIAARRA
jgi:SAM-dependent methyltransferase